MNKKVYVDLSQQDVQDIINAYEKDIEKLNKQKEVLKEADEAVEYWQKECDKRSKVLDKIKEYCIKEQARIVINNTEEDEFVYTELLQLIDKLLEEIE